MIPEGNNEQTGRGIMRRGKRPAHPRVELGEKKNEIPGNGLST